MRERTMRTRQRKRDKYGTETQKQTRKDQKNDELKDRQEKEEDEEKKSQAFKNTAPLSDTGFVSSIGMTSLTFFNFS